MRFFNIIIIGLLILSTVSGCEIMPVTRFKPVMQNPFPQLKTVAVLPFLNKTDNSNVNGSEIARLYAEELQKIPGFDVLAVRAVEEKMAESGFNTITNADDVRLLAKILGVEAVVIGRVNDYDCYYPPKLGLTVEWYAANPYFYPVPAGYGLPWGTTKEEEIPLPIVAEAERELARAQLATQTPLDPEGEATYQEFLEAKRQHYLRLKQEAERGYDQQDDQNGDGQHLDPDDPDYQPVDPQAKRYERLQQGTVDQQLLFAYGGKAQIPQSMHNVKLNTRNAESVKRKIAEMLDDDNVGEVGLSRPSPMPGGLQTSDWLDRNPTTEVLQNEMHRTKKPDVTDPFTVSDTGADDADLPPVLTSWNHHRNKGQSASTSQNPISPTFPPNVAANPATNPGFAAGQVSPPAGTGYGILIQNPNPDPNGGGQTIFLSLGPDGAPIAAYSYDPATGAFGREIPLAELGMVPSTLPTTVPPMPDYYQMIPGAHLGGGKVALEPQAFPDLPEDWPDSRGLIPDGPQTERSKQHIPSNVPIMSLTKHYRANDSDFTQALADFDFHFRDDKRVGGWQMTVSDKKAFIAFCCRMHIWEMFSSRGGAGKSETVKRTWKTWYGGQRPY